MVGLMLAGWSSRSRRAGPLLPTAVARRGADLAGGRGQDAGPGRARLPRDERARRTGGRVRDVARRGRAARSPCGLRRCSARQRAGLRLDARGGHRHIIRSWMSLSTDWAARRRARHPRRARRPHRHRADDHPWAGGLVAALLCGLLLELRGRVDPMTGLGAGLGAVVLLGPVVHPWYLLWAAIPLAATGGIRATGVPPWRCRRCWRCSSRRPALTSRSAPSSCRWRSSPGRHPARRAAHGAAQAASAAAARSTAWSRPATGGRATSTTLPGRRPSQLA